MIEFLAACWRRLCGRHFCYTCDRHTLRDHQRVQPLGHVLREEWRRG